MSPPKQNPILKIFCTTREAADLLGVSIRTAQLWSENGLLAAWKTAGGHRRITRDSIEHLLGRPDNAVARWVAHSMRASPGGTGMAAPKSSAEAACFGAGAMSETDRRLSALASPRAARSLPHRAVM